MKQSRDNESLLKKQLIAPVTEEVEKKIAESPYDDPELYYELGMSYFRKEQYREADDAFSHGLCLNPLDGFLHFGRGRARSKLDKLWEALADFEFACRVDSSNRAFRYYLATTENLAGQYEEAVNDFLLCVDLSENEDRFPLVTWIYLTELLELHESEKAQQALRLVPDESEWRQMDYGYHRCVQLFKGLVFPDEFIDLKDMEEKCIKKPGRIQLEQYMMYYGLYAYAVMHNDPKLARHALVTITKMPPSPAFGYKKGMQAARAMNLI